MSMSTNSSFSPEKGFFRAADKGPGDGNGGNDMGKDDENNSEEGKQKEINHKKQKEESGSVVENQNKHNGGEQEQQLNSIEQIRINLAEIDKLRAPNSEGDFLSVYDLIDDSVQIIRNEIDKDTITGKELSAFKYLGSELEKVARELKYKIEIGGSEKNRLNLAEDKEESSQEESHLLYLFDEELKTLESQSFAFAPDDDRVASAFEQIKDYLLKLKEIKQGREPELLKEKEFLLLQLEYKKRREALFKTLVVGEKQEMVPEGYFKEALEGHGLDKMENIIKRLRRLVGEERAKIYSQDLEKVRNNYNSRKWLLITWMNVSPKVFEGSGPEGDRSSFGQVGDNQFPIKGPDFQELILGGLDFDEEFSSILNQRLGSETVFIDRFDQRLNMEELSIKERREPKEIDVTLFTFCMREFDRVYKNGREGTGDKDPLDKDKSITRVTTQNLRDNKGVLIDYVYKKAKKYVEENNPQFAEQIKDQITDHAVELAFRTHLLLTMHHCRYAEGSPSLKDDWYYVFNWPKYALGYKEKGVDKFDWRVTTLQFGSRPGFINNEVSDENVLGKMFEKYKVREVKRSLEKRGLLDQDVRGLRSLHGLINGYAILLEDVSPETVEGAPKQNVKPDYSFLAPPLRYLRQKNKDGNFAKHPAPEGTGEESLMDVFLDEIVDEKGNIVYEEINYSGLGSTLMTYYNAMNQHGINNFLNKFIKAERFEFMKNASSPETLKSWKNEARYCAELLPRVGRFALMGAKDFGDPIKMNPNKFPTEDSKKDVEPVSVAEAVMDRILLQIIFINCILHTSYALEKQVFWTDLQLKEYLLKLSGEKVISVQEALGIYEATATYRGKSKLFIMSVLNDVMDQVEKHNVFR